MNALAEVTTSPPEARATQRLDKLWFALLLLYPVLFVVTGWAAVKAFEREGYTAKAASLRSLLKIVGTCFGVLFGILILLLLTTRTHR